MAQVNTLLVLNRASGNQPASQPSDFVRFQEFSGTLAGKANTTHRHPASDIDGLIPFLLELAADEFEDSQSIQWIISGSQLYSARARLKPAGGLLVDSEGLFVDSGTVSRPGHKHVTADITDYAAALYAQLQALYALSPTIAWGFDGSSISGTVRVRPVSGLLVTADGLAVDFGSGTNQAARGDHTHALLHSPVTLGATQSIDLALVGQQLTAEVHLAPLSGLLISGTGLTADFGTGHNQVARGDHTHTLLHNPVTTVNDASLGLSISGGQLLSGTVRRDPAPPGGFGKIDVTSNGLVVELGTGPDQSAAGNHGHSAATESVSGFLSATDKTRLDTLWATTPSGTLPTSGTMDSLHVRVIYLVNVNTGHQVPIYLDDVDRVHVGNVMISGTLGAVRGI